MTTEAHELTSGGLAEMTAAIDASNRRLGWRDKELSFAERMAMLHSEVSEALEAWRTWGLNDATQDQTASCDGACLDGSPHKPEGVASEFADIAIRLLDDCVLFGVNLEAELAVGVWPDQFVVSPRFPENIDALHVMIARASLAVAGGSIAGQCFAGVLIFLRQLSAEYGIDLDAEIWRKIIFNRTREYRHGGKAI